MTSMLIQATRKKYEEVISRFLYQERGTVEILWDLGPAGSCISTPSSHGYRITWYDRHEIMKREDLEFLEKEMGLDHEDQGPKGG